jgi:hypothetical protein
MEVDDVGADIRCGDEGEAEEQADWQRALWRSNLAGQ